MDVRSKYFILLNYFTKTYSREMWTEVAKKRYRGNHHHSKGFYIYFDTEEEQVEFKLRWL